MRRLLPWIAAALLAAGAPIEAPVIGCMMTEAGQPRLVRGLPGTFLIADPADACPAPPSTAWITKREDGRWWLIRVDPDSGGESARVILDERARFAVAFGDGAAVIAFGRTVAFGDRQWELPADVTALHVMSADWIQTTTEEGPFAWRPKRDAGPFRLPEGGSE